MCLQVQVGLKPHATLSVSGRQISWEELGPLDEVNKQGLEPVSSVAGMLAGVYISFKFCGAIKQNCSFNFWQAGYNSIWRPLFGSHKNQI